MSRKKTRLSRSLRALGICLLFSSTAYGKLRIPIIPNGATATDTATEANKGSNPAFAQEQSSTGGGAPEPMEGQKPIMGPLLFWEEPNFAEIWKLPSFEFPIKILHNLKKLLMYQPPVGLIIVLSVVRLIKSGRLWRWGDNAADQDASEQALSKKESQMDRHTGRALDLDAADLDYQMFGGIERVRRRLLSHALTETKRQLLDVDEGIILSAEETLLDSLQDLMKVTFTPNGSHAENVRRLLIPMATAEHAWFQWAKEAKKVDSDLMRVLMIALQTAEVRILDSMLRLARDRLLRTCFRLSKTVKHWEKRVKAQTTTISRVPMIRSFMATSYEGDRMRLAFAESAFQSELERLGKIVKVLAYRPDDMDDSFLQLATKNTLTTGGQQEDGKKGRREGKARFSIKKRSKLESKRQIPNLSNWSILYNADGRGKIQLQRYDDSLGITPQRAIEVLLQEDAEQGAWMEATAAWTGEVRSTLHGVLEETVDTSIQSTVDQEQQLEDLESTWCASNYKKSGIQNEMIGDNIHRWETMFRMIGDIPRFRRVGDGKSVKWKDANLLHWLRQWDLLGIPSALLHIGLAKMAHEKIIPYWPRVRQRTVESTEIIIEIIQTRFWGPFRDLVRELMSRDTNQLLMGLSLKDEETSLDFMLRDLDFGDGTPQSRHEAILKATRQYENDMNTGLMRHALGGRLIRLILIQVQQLKVGMLHAADTVDVLLQTNRFNIQLLAVIPAIVIVTVGTKLLSRFIFSLRHKDLRPMASVHGQMSGYLNQLDSILLLTKRSLSSPTSSLSTLETLTHRELGAFVLHLYNYLVLLDFSSPQPFPMRESDDIHRSIAKILGPQGTLRSQSLMDQSLWIGHIKTKHRELSKHL